MSVQLQKATQENYWRAVMTIFPLAPDQTIALFWLGVILASYYYYYYNAEVCRF